MFELCKSIPKDLDLSLSTLYAHAQQNKGTVLRDSEINISQGFRVQEEQRREGRNLDCFVYFKNDFFIVWKVV